MLDYPATFYIGCLFIAGALGLIVFNRNVSVGQLAVAALGALILLSPTFRDFEASTAGFKFTTHDQGKLIASSVDGTNIRIDSIEQRLEKITRALEDYSARIASVERSAGIAGSGDAPARVDTTTIQELKNLNEFARGVTGDVTRQLGILQGSFGDPALAVRPIPGFEPLAGREGGAQGG